MAKKRIMATKGTMATKKVMPTKRESVRLDLTESSTSREMKKEKKIKILDEMQRKRELEKEDKKKERLELKEKQGQEKFFQNMEKKVKHLETEHRGKHVETAVLKLQPLCAEMDEAIHHMMKHGGKDSVPVKFYTLQAKMHTDLAKWMPEALKIRGERLKANLDAFSSANKLTTEFVKTMEQFKETQGVRGVVKKLISYSSDFKEGKISLDQYKKLSIEALDKHKKTFTHTHQHDKEVKGLWQHIVNAVRCLMRALVVMVNKVTGKDFTMFEKKKVDTELGKEVKEFKNALHELKEFEEPEPQMSMKK